MLVTAFLALFGCVFSQDDTEWSYRGANGPWNWPTLFPEYCASNMQSPINICKSRYDPTLTPILFEGYEQMLSNSVIHNTGRTIEIIPSSEEFYAISGGGLPGTFVLNNIHFHWGSTDFWGSEHSICFYKSALECHLVHRNENYPTMEEALNNEDGLAVLAVLFSPLACSNTVKCNRCCEAPALSSITDALKDIRYANTEKSFSLGVPLSSLLPQNGDGCYHRYNGSLTTPNCNEVVTWTVYEEVKGVTPEQMDKFRSVYETEQGEKEVNMVNNYRPLQPRNGRPILHSLNCQR